MQRPLDRRLEKSLDTALFGPASNLDSLGLVNLILIAEENVEELSGVAVNLANQQSIAQANNPYLTVGSLSQYITKLLIEASNGSHN
jgi:hypothetical protein